MKKLITVQTWVPWVLLGTLRLEDEDDYEYKFSVLSMHTSKNVSLQTLCAIVWKTHTGTRPRPRPLI